MIKKCPDCKQEWNKEGKSKSNRCPPCRRKWDKDWRKRRKDSGRPVISTKMPYSWQKQYHNNSFSKFKIAVRAKARRAVKSGRIIKESCLICDSPNSEMHHPTYFRPYQVKWYCKLHHKEAQGKGE